MEVALTLIGLDDWYAGKNGHWSWSLGPQGESGICIPFTVEWRWEGVERVKDMVLINSGPIDHSGQWVEMSSVRSHEKRIVVSLV